MSAKPKHRALLYICALSDNSYMVKPRKGDEAIHRERLLVPLVNPDDPRMFVRNGELIKPYTVVEFAFERTELCPELNHDRAFYREVGRHDFDPAGCVPITYFDIEKLADDMNAGQAMVEKVLPDSPSTA